MTESCASRLLDKWQLRIGRGLGAISAVGMLSACNPLDAMPAPSTPEYTLEIDCAVDPFARRQQEILASGQIATLYLVVAGTDYRQQSAVQIFSKSDIRVTAPDGGEPRQQIPYELLEPGQPVAVNLEHGSLTAQRSQKTHPAVASTPAPDTLLTPLSARRNEWLNFSLSCADAPPAALVPESSPK